MCAFRFKRKSKSFHKVINTCFQVNNQFRQTRFLEIFYLFLQQPLAVLILKFWIFFTSDTTSVRYINQVQYEPCCYSPVTKQKTIVRCILCSLLSVQLNLIPGWLIYSSKTVQGVNYDWCVTMLTQSNRLCLFKKCF